MSLKINDIWIGRLQRVFWVLGWATLALMLFSVGTTLHAYFRSFYQTNSMPYKESFVFVVELSKFFSGIAEAFFCFLVSSVFGMIFYKKPIQTQQNERFLILTCLGFLGKGLVGIYATIEYGFYVFPELFRSASGAADVLLLLASYVLSFTPALLWFLYAITIYVVFKYFAQLVTFESEVV